MASFSAVFVVVVVVVVVFLSLPTASPWYVPKRAIVLAFSFGYNFLKPLGATCSAFNQISDFCEPLRIC